MLTWSDWPDCIFHNVNNVLTLLDQIYKGNWSENIQDEPEDETFLLLMVGVGDRWVAQWEAVPEGETLREP